MTYRLPNSRKSNFATEPDSCLSAYVLRDTPPRTRTEGTRLSTLVRHLLYDALRA